MGNKNNQENKFLEQFSDEAAQIDPNFKRKLGNNVLRAFRGERVSKFSFISKMSKLKFASAGLAGLLLFTGVAGVALYPQLRDYYVRKTVDVNDILAKAVKNKQGLNSNQQRSFGAVAAEDQSSTAEAYATSYLSIAPFGSDTYSKSNVTYSYGPASDRCEIMMFTGYGVRTGKSESHSYWEPSENGGRYYDKFILLDEQGNIISYSLSNEDGYYDYRGGEYAILDKSNLTVFETTEVEEPIGEVEDAPVPSEDYDYGSGSTGGDPGSIEDLRVEELESEEVEVLPVDEDVVWGEEQEILGITKINGRDHYIVKYQYTMPCSYDEVDRNVVKLSDATSSSDDGNSDEKTIVVKSYIDVENSNVSREEYFVDSINDNNLVMTNEYQFESSDLEYSAVASKFVFEYDVEVKEVDWTTYNPLDALKDVDEDLIIPVGSGWKAYSITSPLTDWSMYQIYSAREFFPRRSQWAENV